jgi:hypothetical protein
MKKFLFTLFFLIGIVSLIALPCLAAEKKAATPEKAASKAAAGKGMAAKAAAVKAPVVKLERVEVASYWGYNLDGILDKEGKLTAGRRGSPLVLAFVYSVQNPNNLKLMLDEMKFAVFFEDAEVNTLTFFEDNYIPSKTTDFFRISGTFDALVVSGNPNVRASKALTEKNISSADLVKKWWEGIGDFNFPIRVNGTATFVGPDGKNIIVPFEGTFPPK